MPRDETLFDQVYKLIKQQAEVGGCPCSWNPGDGYGMEWSDACRKCTISLFCIREEDIDDMINDAPGG